MIAASPFSRPALPVGRVRTLIVCLAATVALGAGPALASAKPHGRQRRTVSCNSHRKAAKKVAAKVIVYGKQVGLDGYGGELTEYFACIRPHGESVEIGQSDTSDGEYPANFATSDLMISGTYVADIQTSGMADAAACAKYDPTANCQASITSFVEVVDAKTRRRLETTATGGIGPLAVSSLGAVAWVQSSSAAPSSSPPTLQAIVLRRGAPRRLTGTVQTLDSGAIGSLSFSGLTLGWTNAGQAKSQTL